jgi:hypothetical protein
MDRIKSAFIVAMVFVFFAMALRAEEDPDGNSPAPGGGKSDYINIPLSLSFFPMVNLDRKTAVNYSFNILGDYSTRLDGLSAGFGISIVGEDMTGAQIAGIASITGKNMRYVQASWFMNIAGGDAAGVQASGFVNSTGGRMTGFQGSGFLNYSRGLVGFQGGLVNISTSGSDGFQGGLVNVVTDSMRGVQTGLINYATNITGVQMGIINVCRNIEGVPLGLLSIVTNGVTDFDVWGDETGFGHLGVKHGTRYFYNIFTAGARLEEGFFAAGMGWGASLPLDRFFVSLDVIFRSVNRADEYLKGHNILHSQARAYGGVRLMDHLTFFGGMSCNYATAMGDDEADMSVMSNASGKIREEERNAWWPGIFVGVRMG